MIKKLLNLFAFSFFALLPQFSQAQISNISSDAQVLGIQCNVGNVVCLDNLDLTQRIYYTQFPTTCRDIVQPGGIIDCNINQSFNANPNVGIVYALTPEAPVIYAANRIIALTANNYYEDKYLRTVNCVYGTGYPSAAYTCDFWYEYYYNAPPDVNHAHPQYSHVPIFSYLYSSNVICPGQNEYLPGAGCLTENSVRAPISEPSSCDECDTGDSAVAASNAQPQVGNPVDINTGSKIETKIDLEFPILFKRSYLSQRQSASTLGISWNHNYDKKLSIYYKDVSLSASSASSLTFKLENNEEVIFNNIAAVNAVPNFSPIFKDHKGYSVSRVIRSGGGVNYVLNTPSGDKETYYADKTNGKAWLIQIQYKNGMIYDFGYNAQQQLSTITNSYGQSLTFIYSDYANVITQVNASNGDYIQYSYLDGYITQAKFNNSETLGYTYYQGNLVSKIDAKGNTYALFSYDNQRRVLSSQHVASPNNYVSNYTYDYTSTPNTVLTTTPNASQASYTNQKINYRYKTGSSSLGGGNKTTGLTYDASGKPASFNDGINSGTFNYNAATNLLSSSSYKGVSRTYNWNTAKRLINSYVESNNSFSRTYSFTYDANGNTTKKQITGGGETRTWNYTYASFGKLATSTGPTGATTTITYYPDNHADINLRGLPYTITNGMGHITTVNSYDNHAKPTSITQPNGLTKTMTYNQRGQMLSETMAGATNTYIYDANGLITSATLANGATIAFSYDMAHRLIGMSDNSGNSVAYTLDASGNITNESEFAGSNLVSVKNQVYDNLNRVAQISGPGNSFPTVLTYDKLNRVVSVKDANNATQTMTYDAQDNVLTVSGLGRNQTSVRDPDGNITSITQGDSSNTTSFTYNAFGEVLTSTSPDTGYSTYSRSLPGKTETYTDNSSAAHTKTYDNIGRLLSDSDRGTFVWDTAKIGKLSGYSNGDVNTTLSYDNNARLIYKTQTVGGYNKSLQYQYNAAGQLVKIIYPSGAQVEYGYTNGKLSEVKIGSTVLLNQINYLGFSSAPVGWTWGNGQSRAVGIDTAGRLTSLSDSAVMNKTYTLDNLGNITSSTDSANSANSFTATYSQNNQLLTFGNSAINQTFTQDNKFNLTSIAPLKPGTTTMLLDGMYSNNKVSSITYPGYNYYPVFTSYKGNMANEGKNYSTYYAYDAANNMTGIYGTDHGSVSYGFNPLGQRVRKYVPTYNGTSEEIFRTYLYNEQGLVVGEYGRDGLTVMEHVYVGSTPVAVIKNGNIYNVHTDHLGTPRAITSATGTLMWKWDNISAYGNNLANENASGTYFEYNIRFPGQYFDKESGFHYNYYRTYNPELGRYMQPDPIGVNGGMNNYSYVENNPLNSSDPYGLITYDVGLKGPGSLTNIGFTLENGIKSLTDYNKNVLRLLAHANAGSFNSSTPEDLAAQLVSGQINVKTYIKNSKGEYQLQWQSITEDYFTRMIENNLPVDITLDACGVGNNSYMDKLGKKLREAAQTIDPGYNQEIRITAPNQSVVWVLGINIFNTGLGRYETFKY